MNASPQRCAIYTRKSTEERLNQEFNSLDAQREACSAYITSQRHEGWSEVSTLYDDGGFSGGSMERPALKRLLEDVRSGRINVVVVYKVDRLTRSLSDFARIVDILDSAGASFVSVTQSFNTTTSMGRLTLNVLLSFAQFEREVTAERIRDKIGASKRKGMWMGGPVPVGYVAKDRTLVIHEDEANTVHRIFEGYAKLGSVRALHNALKADGSVSRVKTSRKVGSVARGGKPYSCGALYQILRNPIYRGEIPHFEKRYPGRHEAIIGDALWDEVQSHLDAHGGGARHTKRQATARPLDGLLVDGSGAHLRTTYATRKVDGPDGARVAKRYWYYATRLKADAEKGEPVTRIRADAIERLVAETLAARLSDAQWVMDTLCDAQTSTDERLRLVERAKGVTNSLAIPSGQDPMLRSCYDALADLLHRVTLKTDAVAIELHRNRIVISDDHSSIEPILITVPIHLHRAGRNKPVIIESAEQPHRDPDLIAMVADARRWARLLTTEAASSVEAITKSEGIARGIVSRQLPLAWLAPDITTAILEGRQPRSLTAAKLRNLGELPLSWEDQRDLLGFADA